MQEKNNVLYVRFFGAFSVRWNGVQLVNGRESQFIHLLQILLHTRESGADRALLIEELFHDREIRDAAHSLSVLFYTFKMQLKKMRLPDCDYIVKKGGRFYWTDEIPVVEDTVEFEAAYRRATAALTPEDKLHGYLAACELYGGDFLPLRTESLWATREARRYGEMFGNCVNQAAAILLERKQYSQLQTLGKLAARVQPFSNWECITLEALIGLGHYAEADRLSRKTERQYVAELGTQPDARMLELRESIGKSKRPGQKTLEAIEEYLTENYASKNGAYLCSYAIFESIYRVMERLAERSGPSAVLILCTLEEDAAVSNQESVFRDRLVQRFEDAICSSLRKSDIVCRCGEFQYLVLLTNTTQEGCAAIQARISARFDKQKPKHVIHYCTRVIE